MTSSEASTPKYLPYICLANELQQKSWAGNGAYEQL